MPFTLSGALIMDGSRAPRAGLVTVNGETMDCEAAKPSGSVLALPDCAVFPGLFNACDSLLGSVLPRFGRGPYEARSRWEAELGQSRAWDELQKISPEDRILLGIYRQILSGVTTVFDPDWHAAGKLAPEFMPIHVLSQFVKGHGHFPAMPLDGDLFSRSLAEAAKRKWPFVVSVEEGLAQANPLDIEYLHSRKALRKSTVLLHGVASSERDLDRIAAGKCSLVFCPSSEKFLYGRTADLSTLLKKGVPLSIGSDAALAGGQSILEELKAAREIFQYDHKKALGARELVAMVTTTPAEAFGLGKRAGRLAKGAPADLVVVQVRKGQEPHAALVEAKINDLHLVVASGNPLLAKESCLPLVKACAASGQKVNIHGESYWLAGKPLDLKKRVEAALGASLAWRFFPIGL